MNETLAVEIWSDLICPWCWIGKRRFERALTDFPHRENVRIIHRAFRLMPGLAPHALEDVIGRRFARRADFEAMLAEVERTAAGEGLVYHLAGSQVGDTRDAHRLVLDAASQGRQAQLVERFYRAYFTERASLFDRDILLNLAVEAGLDRDRAALLLSGTDLIAEVEEDEHKARALGAGGVPFFLIGGRIALSGAQPAEEFLAALTRAWSALPAAASAGGSAACSPDGCSVP
jgi:predicted DsbA family dithiol-disulfide isomerase